jgi:hypothetical protein
MQEARVNLTDLVQQMCRSVLSQADIKAICKVRSLPAAAADSHTLLETLFVTDSGLAAALQTLERNEVAALHLLLAIDKPVDVSFFRRVYPKQEGYAYGSFTQRYQKVLAKVKERLVRSGLLVMTLGHSWSKKSQMERWQFAVPPSFAAHLPPLVESAAHFTGAGDGDWRREVARQQLQTALGRSSSVETKKEDRIEIADGELRWGGQPFRAERPGRWQKECWLQDTGKAKKADERVKDSYALPVPEAMVQILGGLPPGSWADADGLAAALEIFCGSKVDGTAALDSGYRWGCLARHKADGKTWYRTAPQLSAADVSPNSYLDVTSDGQVAVDLDAVPFESLEQLVTISNQRPSPGKRPVLLVTPNLIKLGRAADEVLTSPLLEWLQRNSPAFQQAIETRGQRRGKTLVHENLCVARVGDLGLKVAIEKALGERIVPLGDEYIAFAQGSLGDVKRVVIKSGHVVKEAANHAD